MTAIIKKQPKKVKLDLNKAVEKQAVEIHKPKYQAIGITIFVCVAALCTIFIYLSYMSFKKDIVQQYNKERLPQKRIRALDRSSLFNYLMSVINKTAQYQVQSLYATDLSMYNLHSRGLIDLFINRVNCLFKKYNVSSVIQPSIQNNNSTCILALLAADLTPNKDAGFINVEHVEIIACFNKYKEQIINAQQANQVDKLCKIFDTLLFNLIESTSLKHRRIQYEALAHLHLLVGNQLPQYSNLRPNQNYLTEMHDHLNFDILKNHNCFTPIKSNQHKIMNDIGSYITTLMDKKPEQEKDRNIARTILACYMRLIILSDISLNIQHTNATNDFWILLETQILALLSQLQSCNML